jgi:hypothetical protein
MDNMIEVFDEQRMNILKWYVISFALFMALILTRHFFRRDGLNEQPIGTAVLIGLLITLGVIIICVIRLALVEREIRKDPKVEAALHNELVKAIDTQAWIAAFLATCLMTLFWAVTSSFYPICDAVSISLSSICAGAGANRAYFYFRYKAS